MRSVATNYQVNGIYADQAVALSVSIDSVAMVDAFSLQVCEDSSFAVGIKLTLLYSVFFQP